MPTYAYKCDSCGHLEDDFRPIRDRKNPWPCPKCGQGSMQYAALETMKGRSRHLVTVAMGFDMDFSDSMGINPDFPQDKIPGQDYTPDGALIIHGPRHRREMMKRLGLRDR